MVGSLIGWLASLFMGTDGRQSIILNVLVGIVGAVLGGWLLGGLVAAGSSRPRRRPNGDDSAADRDCTSGPSTSPGPPFVTQ